MIPITVNYEIVTHESAEHGEAAESGVHLEDSFSFRDLLRWLDRNGSWEASSYPLRSLSGRDWLTSADADINYRTGEHKRLSVHLAHDAPARARKHWVRALRYIVEGAPVNRTARLDYRPGSGPALVTFNPPKTAPAAPSVAHLLPDWQRALQDIVAAQGPSRAATALGIARTSLWRYVQGTRQPDVPTQRSIVASWARARGLTC